MVPRRPRTLTGSRLLVALVVALTALATEPPMPADAASERLPDLRAARIRDLRIERLGDRRVLRFTGIMWNKGKGPFEIRAKRATRKAPWDVDQIVYDSAGRTRRVQTDARMRYADDGHDHWHVRRMLTYHLWGANGTTSDGKIGFCFFDTNLVDGSLPRSPSRKVYTESMCGRRDSLRTRNGISVGWGDRYAWDFAYQWIDITGLEGGTYMLRAAVDLYGSFVERSDSNNCAWSRIRFGDSGTKVKVLASGFGCIDDHSASPYADDVAWAMEQGVSAGCDADMFCTNEPLTRARLAAFLARAYDLPPATEDWFRDDEGTANEASIDRVAEAGLMTGCGTTTFCPKKRATREQVARAIAVAMSLPPATTDHFDDDDGRPLEADIDRVAEAGVMAACGERRFCPTGSVSRGQLVRYLRLSLEPPDVPDP